ncbi:TPA: DNA gyrase subunit A [Legionella pneumophila]|uniref:DNA gyrase subunit A n=1 Tax=Legionella pneumophila (strain Lens) TaxID=297245 RepID=Q5WWT1_LEGPL|nr:DNA gyrase subunit A [Legionella pneumophila]AOW52038.1 DNA gyrase subunit A [Legionella pneumophila subsp. pneumophila]AOW54370.1 DNA gyrase subunit A [Legionella pneumophila subsp. pneumophila]AOW57335.1 DNA gyrase subunit A [Legionella pneumophila subsp. pneumophila]AOW59740.1 DNA gyrase subunit A [Legionella pneumophila subsp. pneumophila]AOW62833.1 DNA gyrase subunit A [Legionella pneumophila subsp. pneumophila]
MVYLAKEVLPVNIEDELKQSYLDYAMSVIVGRALPDVRDGLKPVHRRVLFAMSELGNDWNKPYKKSARVVGDVIGKYHPHGDTAVYDTIVRMAQPFSMRYMLIDGQGNFGSVDGDAPAAMRYTEVRMSKVAHALLADLDKETVDFSPNYDETEFAPVVLPSRIPNLLVNGSSGIAVGMATNIPPHNLTEVINACIALVDEPDTSLEDLMEIIPGPDFPTAAIINGRAGIIEGYRTGKGRVVIRARTEIETDESSGRQSIIIQELPYQVNKARLIERIAELVRDKKIEGISGLRDESDKQGMRVVIELKRNEVADVVLNNLFAHTQMQNVFGINMVALVDGQPRTLNLKQILEYFIKHRREVVTRRTIFELKKARNRAHLLEGLGIALANIDEMIALIKQSSTPQDAKSALLSKIWQPGLVKAMLEKAGSNASRPDDLTEEYGLHENGYKLSEAQAQAILELRLHRLTALEQDKIINEFEELLNLIKELLDILASPERLMQVIRDELIEIKSQFGDERRTEITASQEDLTIEDLITEEDVVVTLSHQGYVKYQPITAYQAQRRGGKGKSATHVKDEDFVERLVIASTHDTLLCFSNHGKLYWLKAYQLPQASRASRGRPIINILPLAEGEEINAMLPVREYKDGSYVFMATKKGTVKKVPLNAFSRPRSNGIIAVDLEEDDSLVGVDITDGARDIMLFTDAGKVIRFDESKVRPMGRTARGVRGIRVEKDQAVKSLVVVDPSGGTILTATENGYGKRTHIDEYRVSGRGGQGVISIQVTERNGKVVRSLQVTDNDEAMLITDKGTLVRFKVNELSVIGRNTQGVRLINVSSGEAVVGMQKIVDLGEELEEAEDSSLNAEDSSDE